MVKEEDKDQMPEEEDWADPETGVTTDTRLLSAHVSLRSIMGLSPPRSRKILGDIGERKVTVLIHRGATHSFICNRLVRT